MNNPTTATSHLDELLPPVLPPPLLTKLLMGISRSWPFARGRQRWRNLLRKTLNSAPATVLVSLRSSKVKVEVPWADYSGINLIAFGENDADILRFLVHCMEFALRKSKIGEIPLYLDIGANLGAFALRVANRLPVRSVAFEPNPFLVSIFQRNLRRNTFKGCVDLRPIALGASPGTVHLSLSAHDSGNTKVIGATNGACPVPQHKLTQEFSPAEWKRVGVVKMDVEGYESDVLTGATSLFAEYQPPLVLEVNTDELAERGRKPADLGRQLASLGYSTFFALDKVAYPISNGVYRVANIIALPKGMQEMVEEFGFSKHFRPRPQPLWPVVHYPFNES